MSQWRTVAIEGIRRGENGQYDPNYTDILNFSVEHKSFEGYKGKKVYITSSSLLFPFALTLIHMLYF